MRLDHAGSAVDLKFLQSGGELDDELQIQKPHYNYNFASVPLIPKFASEGPQVLANFGIGLLAVSVERVIGQWMDCEITQLCCWPPGLRFALQRLPRRRPTQRFESGWRAFGRRRKAWASRARPSTRRRLPLSPI